MERKTLTFGESNVAAITAFAGTVAGSLIVSLTAMLIALAAGNGVGGDAVDAVAGSAGMTVLLLALTQVLLFAGAAFYLSVFRRVSYFKLFSFGFGEIGGAGLKKAALLPLITVGAILLFLPFAELFVYILSLFGYSYSGTEIGGGDNAGSFVTMLLAVAVLPAFGEEMLFRGVYLNGARRRGSFFAVCFSSLVFMLYHGSPLQTVHQFLLGLILAYVAVVTGHIGYGIIIHFLNNFIGLFMGYIPFGELPPGILVLMYAVWAVVGFCLLVPSLKAFTRLCDKENGISNADGAKRGFFETAAYDIAGVFTGAFRLIARKTSPKELISEFNAKYDPRNKFGGGLGGADNDNTVFLFGKDEPKKLPPSAIVLIVGFSLLWLISLSLGFLNGWLSV
ncbi:MAG: CPBP family intramembrane metalloprotease [Clostridiales bacterium]|nr:CPBP family intramembrane metalloprotease [Clostridiales bacterium]